jgi:EmrB/QacA subfamily drug resistance transporter
MTDPRAERSAAGPWAILAVLSLASFLVQLDLAVLAVAVPSIQADLGAATEQVVWAIGAYILVLAVFLITAGRLGDLFGRRRVFLVGVAVFTAASAAAGMAQSPGQLIAARAVQGLGAALLTPQTLALLVDAFPAERRGLALGIRGAVGGVATVTGPVVGGLFAGALDWRWVFYVNLPLGVTMLVLGWLLLPRDAVRRRQRLDVAGVVLGTATLLGAAGVINGVDAGQWSPANWAALAVTAGCAAAFVAQQRRRQYAEPLVPFALFRDRNYALMIGYSLTTSSIVVGLVLALSLFFQSTLALDPVSAGLLIVPASLMSTIVDPGAGRLADRVDGRILLLTGAAFTVAGIVWAAAEMRSDAQWAAFIAPMAVIGVGNAFLFTPLAVVALGGVTTDLAGAASGILVTALQIGSMLGAAVTGAILGTGSAQLAPGTARAAMLALAAIATVGAAVSLAVRPRPAAGPAASVAPPVPVHATADRG